jgi:hypothetical protein
MLIKRADRPVVSAIFAVAVSLLLNIQLSFAEDFAPKNNTTDQGPHNIGEQMVSWLLGWTADDSIAVLTLVIAGVGFFQWRHFRVTERAYVKMSHRPPGINWESPLLGNGVVTLRVKNFGKTPADISDAYVEAIVRTEDTIERLPPYNPEARVNRLPVRGFLVDKDEFFFDSPVNITPTQRASIEAKKAVLIIFGYVDYIDKFGQRQRGGYARMYDPVVDREAFRTSEDRAKRNNLPIFPHRDWNFDRSRARGVGSDWD